jgi:acyl-CoA synthetase (AMP-forming)/AMP-acid ligase II
VNATIPSVGDLQAFLGERLARYKIPRLFVPVESIGRGPNGKASYPEARQRAVEFEAAMRAGHDINAQSAALSANGNP